MTDYMHNYPSSDGYFGEFGGSYLPEGLKKHFEQMTTTYLKLRNDKAFLEELDFLRKHYQGRPTPITRLHNLSRLIGGAEIYLKREDLNHMGAHKLNHCLGEALLAKKMGKKKLIAETGAGQHGVALATAAAYVGLECEIHMGEVDMKKQRPNVIRMELLGAKIVEVSFGAKTLKEAVDSAFQAYLQNPEEMFFAIGSVVGPHPFPLMVRDFQSVVGEEAKKQFQKMTGKNPDHIVACVGGGSNAIGIFQSFLNHQEVKLHGVEPLGKSNKIGEHAATLTYGKVGQIHGFRTMVLQDEEGNPSPVYSIASGLDYPGVGPEHAFLQQVGRVQYGVIDDRECLRAFYLLSREEGIIPALESAHAVAFALKLAKDCKKTESILVNLSGRGDKDIEFVAENYKMEEETSCVTSSRI